MAEPKMLIPLPDDMARLMKLTQWQAGEIERLRERVFELEADPKSGDVIPLAEPRCGDLRRSAERCITAWTVVRGGVWDPNGLMDEHMDALRKALRPSTPVGWSDTDWIAHLEKVQQNEVAYARGPLPERGWD